MNTTTKPSHGPDGAYHHMKGSLKISADDARKLVSEMTEKAEMLASSIEGKANGYFENGTAYVKKNPVKSLAYVTVAGALAGGILTLFLGRSRK